MPAPCPGQPAAPEPAELRGANYTTRRHRRRKDTLLGLQFCPKLTFNMEQNVTFASPHNLKISPYEEAIRKAFKN